MGLDTSKAWNQSAISMPSSSFGAFDNIRVSIFRARWQPNVFLRISTVHLDHIVELPCPFISPSPMTLRSYHSLHTSITSLCTHLVTGLLHHRYFEAVSSTGITTRYTLNVLLGRRREGSIPSCRFILFFSCSLSHHSLPEPLSSLIRFIAVRI